MRPKIVQRCLSLSATKFGRPSKKLCGKDAKNNTRILLGLSLNFHRALYTHRFNPRDHKVDNILWDEALLENGNISRGGIVEIKLTLIVTVTSSTWNNVKNGVRIPPNYSSTTTSLLRSSKTRQEITHLRVVIML